MKWHWTMKQRFFVKSFCKNAFLILVPILLIGPYSIWQLNKQSRETLERSSYNLLYQMDETMNSLLSELDNVYYYIRSNPSITTSLKAAYSERSLTLNSLRNISNISSLLRYYMYTNEYIKTIYVYYDNDNNRLLVPELGMISMDAYIDLEWIALAKDSEQDIWLETAVVSRDKYTAPKQVLYYCRKLYSTIDPSAAVGVIVVEYDAELLLKYMDSLNLYKGQTIAIMKDDGQLLLKNGQTEVELFMEGGSSTQGEYEYFDQVANRERYTVSRMQSAYLKQLSYLSIVPTNNIMQSSNQFAHVFFVLIVFGIFLAMIFAMEKTRADYKRLEKILNLLTYPEQAISEREEHIGPFSDPYNYITYNIINLFIQQNYLKMQTSEQRYKLQVMELTALQQQINPHFLHNTLNTIYWEAVKLTQGSNLCSEMITKLASIMRYSLSNPEEWVTIKEELSYLKNYVYIQTVRFNYCFQVEYDVDERTLDLPIRKIILQPLVENAISHGIKEKKEAGWIRVKIYFRTNYVYISVLDNGVGIHQEQLKELRQSFENSEEYNLHVGLYNCHRRLVLVSGQSAGLHIRSHEGKGTCVFFRLPYTK